MKEALSGLKDAKDVDVNFNKKYATVTVKGAHKFSSTEYSDALPSRYSIERYDLLDAVGVVNKESEGWYLEAVGAKFQLKKHEDSDSDPTKDLQAGKKFKCSGEYKLEEKEDPKDKSKKKKIDVLYLTETEEVKEKDKKDK